MSSRSPFEPEDGDFSKMIDQMGQNSSHQAELKEELKKKAQETNAFFEQQASKIKEQQQQWLNEQQKSAQGENESSNSFDEKADSNSPKFNASGEIDSSQTEQQSTTNAYAQSSPNHEPYHQNANNFTTADNQKPYQSRLYRAPQGHADHGKPTSQWQSAPKRREPPFVKYLFIVIILGFFCFGIYQSDFQKDDYLSLAMFLGGAAVIIILANVSIYRQKKARRKREEQEQQEADSHNKFK